MLKLASWNVNSLKVRLEQVLNWMESTKTDVLALQETKLTDENFPVPVFKDKGWHIAFAGQKTYNGVAVISRFPLAEVQTDIPDFDDPQRRILAVTVAGIRLINLYVPNGSSVGSEKYAYKLDWLKRINQYIAGEMKHHADVAVVGDFNIAPEDCDVHDPAEWQNCIHVSELERQAFFDLLALGLKDSFRLIQRGEPEYSWWDYRAASFRRNRGLRIDHILLSETLSGRCTLSAIDKTPRKHVQPSDHAPVWVELDTLLHF